MDINLNNTNNDLLQQYLDGKLTGEALQQFQQQLANDELMQDAVEGLSIIQNKKSINVYVNDLNNQLHKYTSSKKQRRLKHKLEIKDWIIFAVCFIIIVCIVVGFFIVKHN